MVYEQWPNGTVTLAEVAIPNGTLYRSRPANGTQGPRYVYSLTDHLGNVRAVVPRGWNPTATPPPGQEWIRRLSFFSDYYPYGWSQPGRDMGLYRYGFQGQEKDPETDWWAFQLRMYDGRVGRWMTIDPKAQYYSPYISMGNDPISSVDPDGGFKTWFGAFFEKIFQGGGDILFAKDRKEWFVSRDWVENNEGGLTIFSKRIFESTRGNTPFIKLEGSLTLGAQAGVNATVGPLQGKVNVNLANVQLANASIAAYAANSSRSPFEASIIGDKDYARVSQGIGANVGIPATNLQVGLGYERSFDGYGDGRGIRGEVGGKGFYGQIGPYKANTNVLGNVRESIDVDLSSPRLTSKGRATERTGFEIEIGAALIVGANVKLTIGPIW